jgi:hypothetical protein
MYESSRKILPEIPYEIQQDLANEGRLSVIKWLEDLGYDPDVDMYPWGMPMTCEEEGDATLYRLHEYMVRQESSRAVDQIADYLD